MPTEETSDERDLEYGYQEPLRLYNSFPRGQFANHYDWIGRGDAGTWKDIKGNIVKIKDMETSHIFNCIKLLEKKLWSGVDMNVTPEIRREICIGAIRATPKWIELRNELLLRIRAGKVNLSDFFFGAEKLTVGVKNGNRRRDLRKSKRP